MFGKICWKLLTEIANMLKVGYYNLCVFDIWFSYDLTNLSSYSQWSNSSYPGLWLVMIVAVHQGMIGESGSCGRIDSGSQWRLSNS